MMRVVVEALGVGVGGGGIILEEVLAELSAGADCRVTLVMSHRPSLQVPAGVECWVLPGGSCLPWRVFWAQCLAQWWEPISGADVLLTLTSLTMTRRTPTIAYVQNALPFVSGRRGMHSALIRARHWGLRQVMGRVIGRAELVAVQTQWMARRLRFLGVRPLEAKTVVVRPKSPCQRLRSHADSRSADHTAPQVVLYVGSALPHKNLDTLMAAWQGIVSQRGDHAELWLTATEFPCDATRGVHFLGAIDRDELCGIYKRATLLVQPSLIETLSLPLLEGMAHGLPVVAPDAPYAREVLAGAGRYFKPRDAKELRACILSILDDPGNRYRLSQASGRRLEEWERLAAALKMSDMVNALAAGRLQDLPGHELQEADGGSD